MLRAILPLPSSQPLPRAAASTSLARAPSSTPRFPWMTCAAIRIPLALMLHLRFLPSVVIITHCNSLGVHPHKTLCDLVLIYSL